MPCFFGSDYCESINKSHVGWLSHSNHNFSPVTLKFHGWWSFLSFPPWKTAMTTAIQLQGFLWWNPYHRSSLTVILTMNRILPVFKLHFDHHLGMDQYLLIPFLGGWTSINPSYFDVNYRGTRFWHTATFLHFARGHHRVFFRPEVSGGVLPRAAGVRSSRDRGAATAAALPPSEAVGPRSGRGGAGWRGGAGCAVEKWSWEIVEVEMGEIHYMKKLSLLFFESWWMVFFSSDISVCAMAKAWIYAMEIGI